MTRELHDHEDRDEPSLREPRSWPVPSAPVAPVGPVGKVWPEALDDSKDSRPDRPAAA